MQNCWGTSTDTLFFFAFLKHLLSSDFKYIPHSINHFFNMFIGSLSLNLFCGWGSCLTILSISSHTYRSCIYSKNVSCSYTCCLVSISLFHVLVQTCCIKLNCFYVFLLATKDRKPIESSRFENTIKTKQKIFRTRILCLPTNTHSWLSNYNFFDMIGQFSTLKSNK